MASAAGKGIVINSQKRHSNNMCHLQMGTELDQTMGLLLASRMRILLEALQVGR